VRARVPKEIRLNIIQLLEQAHYSNNLENFQRVLHGIRIISLDTYDYINSLPRNKWARFFMNFQTMDTHTNGIAESFNNIIPCRSSNIIGIVTFIHNWSVTKWMERQNDLLSFNPYTNYCHQIIQNNLNINQELRIIRGPTRTIVGDYLVNHENQQNISCN
jgi:hypothetical protein